MPAAKFFINAGLSVAATLFLLFATRRSFYRARLIEDMPTSRIRSASQGYVELSGFAAANGGQSAAPLTARPCLWWRFKIEKYKRSRRSSTWVTIEKGTSEQPFWIRDNTGQCQVYPAGAEIACLHRQVWYGSTPRPTSAPARSQSRFSLAAVDFGIGSRYRYSEYLIRNGDPLYVLGHFQTDASGRRTLTVDRLTGEIIRNWKTDYPALLARFDSNSDQQLDAGEWRAVREAARASALDQQRQDLDRPAEHSLARPESGGLPFLISSHGQEQLSRKFRLKAVLAAAGFLAAGSMSTWLLSSRFL